MRNVLMVTTHTVLGVEGTSAGTCPSDTGYSGHAWGKCRLTVRSRRSILAHVHQSLRAETQLLLLPLQ